MSYSTSNHYETIYILKSGISDSNASTIHEKVDNVIAKFNGKLEQRDDWGLKEFSYPIGKDTMGRYFVTVYTGDSGVVEEIERHFKILDNVVRFMTVRVPTDYDYNRAKKQIQTTEEEVKRAREARKKSQMM